MIKRVLRLAKLARSGGTAFASGDGAEDRDKSREAADKGEEARGKAEAHEKARVAREFWPKFKRFAARLPFAEDLVAAYFCAFDRTTPRHVQAALLGALAYFVLPFDAIPDMLPVIGFTDDAAVLATAVKLVASHIAPRHRQAARRVLARLARNAETAATGIRG